MSTEHPRLPWPTRPEDYVVAEPVQGPISQREQGYQAGYAEAFPEREQLLAERAEARAERDDMDAYAQRLRGAVLDLKAERDSLAAQLAEAWEEIKLQRTLRSAVLAERAALAAQLERARPVLVASVALREVWVAADEDDDWADEPLLSTSHAFLQATKAYQSSPSEPQP